MVAARAQLQDAPRADPYHNGDPSNTTTLQPKNNSTHARQQYLKHKTNNVLLTKKCHFAVQDMKHPCIHFKRRPLHTSAPCSDIMEFFDKEDYWGASKIRVGRSWLKEELRLKSNEDLHKLW